MISHRRPTALAAAAAAGAVPGVAPSAREFSGTPRAPGNRNIAAVAAAAAAVLDDGYEKWREGRGGVEQE